MATVVGEDGTVNPPPSAQTTNFYPRIKDARGKWVSDKGPNQPYLQYREWKVIEEEKARIKAEKIKRRQEKLAKGEPLGPEDELDPEPSTILSFLKFVLVSAAIILALGWFITGSPLWEWDYEDQWQGLIQKHFPPRQLLLTELELAHFDGTDAEKPVYVAIDGDIYDVSEGRKTYSPGGGYHNFAGVDAARAFATQCTNGHRTHDIRGLTEAQLGSLDRWKKYYTNKPKYPKIGRVLHMPIDPRSPLPLECGKDGPGGKPVLGPKSQAALDKKAAEEAELASKAAEAKVAREKKASETAKAAVKEDL